MGLASEMKNLSDELLNSFKQRINENEELVNEVQRTLDGFREDHNEMASVLNSNAASLRKGLALGEKERKNAFNDLMTDINKTIGSLQKEVVDIQASTFKMISDFSGDRSQMTQELNTSFAKGRSERYTNEKDRMKGSDTLMKSINNDIKTINKEVAEIFGNTNNMLERFEKERNEMSIEVKAELSKNLTDRVEFTRSLLFGFQKRLSEINKENQNMSKLLRKDLAKGESARLDDYNDIMKGIHSGIKEIGKEVMNIKKATNNMLDDLLENRKTATAEWEKMEESMNEIRKTASAAPKTQKDNKTTKKAVAINKPVFTATKLEVAKQPEKLANPVKTVASSLTLKDKILEIINKNPKGLKISEMEKPLGETRMKLGAEAKHLLDEGKLKKTDNLYLPV